jgi:hypothetical protein
MCEIHPKRYYEFKKNKDLHESIRCVSNYRFQFKMFENSRVILLVYLSCYGVLHYETYHKNQRR